MMRITAYNTSHISLLFNSVHYYELIMVKDINFAFFVKEKISFIIMMI